MGIVVLSLFDGISCGRLALERAGIKVDAYYASEIDESAEKIFLLGANHIVDLYITASSATDIYYLIRKHLHNTQL